MRGSQTSQRLTQQALEEHQQIHFFLDQIDQALENLRDGLSDVEPMRRLAAQIESLEDRLKEHHQFEEHHGLFRAILEALPAARVEISRLVKQHGKFLDRPRPVRRIGRFVNKGERLRCHQSSSAGGRSRDGAASAGRR